jgi:hypothetical protein
MEKMMNFYVKDKTCKTIGWGRIVTLRVVVDEVEFLKIANENKITIRGQVMIFHHSRSLIMN